LVQAQKEVMNYIEGVSAAITNNDGKILVVRRSAKDDFLAGYYEMPGGKIEKGESHEQAVRREIHEELSLNVDVIMKFHEFSYQPGPNTKCVDHQYLVKLNENDNLLNLKLSHEHDIHKWINLSELDKLSPITTEAKESLRLAFREVLK
jgi:8-oxo-dGTP diphosphatase